MEGVPGDLQTKYQKVASEYSKIRAQANVLKKAVVEEQTRNSELRDVLKEREQSLRKAEQEMDSLTFRNQQLTKRVTVLQDELDLMQARPKKGRSKGPGASPNRELTNHVLDEEFQKKITENACLLSLMQDKDSAHEREMSSLTQRIEKLEHELQQYREVNSDAELKYKAVIERLEEEKGLLMRSVDVKESALEHCSTQLNLLAEQKSQIQMDLSTQLQSATATIAQHLPFVDSRCGDLNELNIPRHDHKQQIYAQHVISQAGLHLHDLTAALSDYHTYSEQRLHAVFTTLSPVNERFSSHLKENARFLRALEQGYTDFQAGLENENCLSLETLPSLRKLSDQLAAYTVYLHRLLPYHCLSIEEESSLSTCTEVLKASNSDVFQHTAELTAHFVKLSTYVKLLAAQSKRACQHPPSSQRRFLLELTEALKALHVSMKDLSRAYSQKSNLEHEMPTSTDRLRATDECLVKSLGAMVSATGKLATVLSDSRAELCRMTGAVVVSVVSSTGTMHPVVSGFKKRAALYVSSLDQVTCNCGFGSGEISVQF
ncbi:protein phosphatase 1 regulatory subunit 21 [Zootermopsis nevadensis]|uniref:protein phosphatase 1 regulatory subunit 21 n=1 Tax=Zootermopsis nevadensis TaxID=136037 RepID=UPI000B8E4D78|nr:protein phosphatase 1 regulatory subunit 21 [Zootermopsis nevadensis]XP_021920004.1 protein phosphatase 1 regulatory subunit 21 [Zootermopsis nevadensis]XP_021920005.1 protein phosphatase 1 regulatory subunit 21 [Zootermopsis nevadensis]